MQSGWIMANTVSTSPAANALRNCSVMSTSAWLTVSPFSLLPSHQQHRRGDGAAADAGQRHLGARHLPFAALAPQLLHRLGQLPEAVEPAAAEVTPVSADRKVAAEAAPAFEEERPGLALLHEAEIL